MFTFRTNGRAFVATHPVTGVAWVFWSKAKMYVGTCDWLR